MKGSLIIVSFFIVGTLCGFFHLIPYDFTDSKLSYYALCGLMFCVGTSIGNDPNTLKKFPLTESPSHVPAYHDNTGYTGRVCRSRILHESTFIIRMYGNRSRIRLLFAFQYIHHRIQRTGIGDYCIALQYHA